MISLEQKYIRWDVLMQYVHQYAHSVMLAEWGHISNFILLLADLTNNFTHSPMYKIWLTVYFIWSYTSHFTHQFGTLKQLSQSFLETRCLSHHFSSSSHTRAKRTAVFWFQRRWPCGTRRTSLNSDLSLFIYHELEKAFIIIWLTSPEWHHEVSHSSHQCKNTNKTPGGLPVSKHKRKEWVGVQGLNSFICSRDK